MARNQSVADFQRLMEQVPKEIVAPITREIEAQGENLARAMVLTVPVGRGRLRNSIRVERSSKRPLGVVVRAGGPTTTEHGYDYSLAQEYGTQKTQAQPFFWPTYRAHKTAIRRNIKAAMKKAIAAKVPLR